MAVGLMQNCTSSQKISRELTTKLFFNQKIDSLQIYLTELDSLAEKSANLLTLQAKFKQARLHYKEIELIIEYYFQGLTRRINGPALPDIKTEDGQVLPPHGFQVIEELLFANEIFDKKELINEVRLLKGDLKFAQNNFAQITLLNRHLHEAIQHQFIRIATLGITGFDSPISFAALPEAQASLKGIQELFNRFFQDTLQSQTLEKLAKVNLSAIAYLADNQDFNSFDRMAFLKNHLIPAGEAYWEISKKMKAPNDTIFDHKFFNGSIGDLFKGQGFKPDALIPYAEARSNPYKVALGEQLFYDNALSKNNQINCGSCHQPQKSFTDGLPKATNFVHGGNLARNTPTILYSALQNNQFYDLRANQLEDQIEVVMRNSQEFNTTPQEISQKIANQATYRPLFKKAFPKKDKFTAFEIRNAIASYIRAQNPFSSRFDEYLQGNKNALNSSEIKGFNLFSGKAKCATCHFLPVFNGTIPPWFNKTESEVIGVPQVYALQNAKIDTDSGRYLINRLEGLEFAFKTPTIRNIEHTAPYMHNGVYQNLTQVIEFYNLGGGKGIGIDLAHQTLPEDKLNLSEQEQKDLLAFLKSLSETKQKSSPKTL
jgi:cytochrome c peroxidase